MMHGCKKCMKIGGIIFLVLGLLFLLVDIGVWNFFSIQWWTVIFILMGLMTLGQNSCPDCQAMRMPEAKGKKKR